MTIVASWLRLELRRRWRSLLVLALLVAVSAGVVMTSLAAARRGSSSLSRLGARTLPATVAVLANRPGLDWDDVEKLPEVAALTRFVVDYNLAFDGLDGANVGFPPADDAMMRTIEKPVVFAGRTVDPTRADEAVVTRNFVSSYHKGVGDTVVLHLPSAQQLADWFAGEDIGRFDGPRIRVHIVGVVVSPWISDSPDAPGGIQISPGLAAKYPLETIGDPTARDKTQFVNTLIRLRGGEAAIPQFREDLARLTGRSDISVTDELAEARVIQRSISFESRCLLAFALAAFVAAMFLVGQAIVRYAAASTAELHTLQSLGMTPMQATVTAAAGPSIVGLVGAIGGAAAAWVASNWFPYGTADYFEPTPGRSWDWLVLGVGAVAVFAVITAGASGAARLSVAAARRQASTRRSAVASAVARSGAPVPMLIGARFALEAGRGRTSVPVRPALIGAFMGVVGIVGAFTFSHGVSDAAAHPSRFGQTFQLKAFIGLNGDDPPAKVLAQAWHALMSSDLTVAADDTRTAVATGAGGDVSVSLWEHRAEAKSLPTATLSGRVPRTANEVMLAPQTLTAMHAHVGGTVVLTGNGGPRTLTVTGSGLVPEGPHNGYADGGWVSRAGYDSLFTGYKFRLWLIAVPEGTDPESAAAALTTSIVKAVPAAKGLEIEPGDLPTEVAEIRQVRTLPVLLGAFLAILAVGAVGHALATAVRRRSRDLAVLRAVGMTQWQCRWVVITQASVLALIGLAFGVPVGLALGRTVWRFVAEYTPILYVPPLATWALLLVTPAALMIANTLAAWPARRAARMRVSQILRAE
jgi:ABC-type lipoprotein release transport system permease subunit